MNDALRRLALQAEREKFERAFRFAWDQLATGIPLREQYRIVQGRQWRFDFVQVDAMVAIELDGGLYANGGHSRGVAIEEQYAKCNAAARLGWCVLKFGTRRLTKEMQLVVEEVREVIERRMGTR